MPFGWAAGCGFGIISPPPVAMLTVTVIVPFTPFGAVAVIVTLPVVRACSVPPASTLTCIGLLLVKVSPVIGPIVPLLYVPTTVRARVPPPFIIGMALVPLLPLAPPVAAVTVAVVTVRRTVAVLVLTLFARV